MLIFGFRLINIVIYLLLVARAGYRLMRDKPGSRYGLKLALAVLSLIALYINVTSGALVREVFEVTDRAWRGIGTIPQSGWRLSPAYADFDAETRFDVTGITTEESGLCRSGEVLQGLIRPVECEAFGRECTPRSPLGAPMVSSEGACAAYYQFRRLEPPVVTA